MTIPPKQLYSVTDYYALPENIRAELIGGQFYYQAAPSRVHQEILSNLLAAIHHYIKAKGGACKVYPAPFAVQLKADRPVIVEPDISVICDHSKLTEKGCTGAPDWIIEIVSPGISRKSNFYSFAFFWCGFDDETHRFRFFSKLSILVFLMAIALCY